ncbi:tripartite tricarboxylate transporter permease [Microbacterium sp. NC79]|nr:tripartite tricarboxylate transporter permease [Microbacterium sp. NC79]
MAPSIGFDTARGMISLALGMAISLIGIDFQSGQPRLTFGLLPLFDGIDVVVLIVALFAIGELYYVVAHQSTTVFKVLPFSGKWMSKDDFRRSWKPWLRRTAIGFPFGVIPAGGSEIPTFLSYSAEKRLSKNPEEFGHGAIEGVAGPEAANNANAAGSLVPLLTLGIPTSATAAVLLVAFQQYGIQTGPQLLSTQANLVWTLIASLVVANLLLLLLNLPLVGLWVKLLKIPKPYLFAGIATFAVLGAYASSGSTFDVILLAILGGVGYLMRRFGYPVSPMIVGAILGPMAEIQFRRTLDISAGDPVALISTPFTWVVYGALAIALTLGVLLRKRPTKQEVLEDIAALPTSTVRTVTASTRARAEAGASEQSKDRE